MAQPRPRAEQDPGSPPRRGSRGLRISRRRRRPREGEDQSRGSRGLRISRRRRRPREGEDQSRGSRGPRISRRRRRPRGRISRRIATRAREAPADGNIRIRVISGCTFNTRHLKQVTGVLKEKFLLVDGESVITGTYSFTWSDSRLERHLVTLLTGEITDSFDNEFRTLFAASRPLQRYDFGKDFNKDINCSVPVHSQALKVCRDPEIVNHISQPEEHIIETNGFSSPEKFNTSGTMQPTEISPPYISPLIGVPLSKSVNKISERRSVVPAMERSSGLNNMSGVPPDSSRMAKESVNVPDYSIRHRLAACHNFEGPSANLLGGQESHSALSDILKNVQRSRLSVAKTTGGRPSKSLWDLSRLSQLSGCSGDPNVRQNPLEFGDEAKNKSRWLSKDTPAMLLMRQRAFPIEDPRGRELANPMSSGFKPSAVISPVRLQGQLVHNFNTFAMPRPWVNPRQIRPRYY